MLPQASYIIKARRWPLIILFLFLTAPFLIIYLAQPEEYYPMYFMMGIAVFCSLFYFALSKLKIYIDDEKLRLEMLLKSKEIYWKDIISSRLNWQIEGTHSAGVSWIFHSKKSNHLELKLGYYSRNDMKILAQQLIDKSSFADIHEKIYKMAEGKFPWYIF
jgi:hypothetical protein